MTTTLDAVRAMVWSAPVQIVASFLLLSSSSSRPPPPAAAAAAAADRLRFTSSETNDFKVHRLIWRSLKLTIISE